MEIFIPNKYIDDIPCKEWLKEIGFEQYAETFLMNMPSKEGPGLLSR